MNVGDGRSTPMNKNISVRELGWQPGVSDSMRERVVQKARELGCQYELNSRAGKDVGILAAGHFSGQGNSIYASLCKKLVQQLSENNCCGVLSILSGEDERGCAYPAILNNGRVVTSGHVA